MKTEQVGGSDANDSLLAELLAQQPAHAAPIPLPPPFPPPTDLPSRRRRVCRSTAHRSAAPLRKFHPLRLVHAYFYDVRSLLIEARLPLLGFVVLTAINIGYLVIFYPEAELSVLQALFETVRMYAFEVNLEWPAHDPIGQALFFITPLLGVALIFQSVLDFGRHLLDKGARREAWQVSLAQTCQNHVIVCGLGRVAYRVVLQLIEAGYEVVAVERDWHSEFVPMMTRAQVPVVIGDARDPDILEQAGLPRACGLVSATSDDLLNIEIALAARRQRSTIQVVMRIFHDDLDRHLEKSFGHNTAFSSSALAAPALAAAAVSTTVAYVVPLEDHLLGVAEFCIAPDSLLTGFVHTIEEQYHVRVLQQLDTTGTWRWPESHRRLEGGDIVLMMGSTDALERAHQNNLPGNKFAFLKPTTPTPPKPIAHRVIVCGLGRVGYRVVRALAAQRPAPTITVICNEQDTPHVFIHHVQRSGIRIVHGDARVPEVLQRAGIAQATSIAVVTSDNLGNIQIGLLARQLNPTIDVVLRVFSDVLAEQLDDIFGAYTAFSTSALAAPTLAAAALVPGVSYAINVGGRLLATARVIVWEGDIFSGHSVESMHHDHHIIVMTLKPAGKHVRVTMPSLATLLQIGDQLDILAEIGTIAHLYRSHPQVSGIKTDLPN